MNTKTIKINNINIHFTKTNKFKTTLVSFGFTNKFKKEEYIKRKALFDLLIESNKEYNSKRKLEIEAQNLYINEFRSSTKTVGNYMCSFINTTFINNKYSEKDNDIKCLNFLKNIIIKPDIKNNEFNKKSFNNIYKKLKTNILSYDDEPRIIAEKECLKKTDINNPINSLFIDINDLKKLKNSDVVNYYNYVINNDRIDIFIIGEYDEKKYIDFFRDLNIGNTVNINNIDYKYNKYKNKEDKIIKKDNRFKQANLIISYKVININEYEKHYLIPIFNTILGGNPSARLFMNIREKNSLAYRISSTYHRAFGILLISSGIDFCNYEKTINLIKDQFNSMRNIKTEELENAKKNIISEMNTIFDNKETIFSYNYNCLVFNVENHKEYINKIKNIKKEEIEKLISKIKIDTIFLLYGE